VRVLAGQLPQSAPNLDELLALASAARPDLRAAELAIEVAGASAGLEKAKIVDLVAALDVNGQSTQLFEIGPGVLLTIPIFNQNQGGRARAATELEQASWTYIATLQRITADVRSAHARFIQAQEALAQWPKQVMEPAENSTRLAKRAYQLGGASHLVVLETTRNWIAAKLQQADLEADLRRAWAELARSVGGDFDVEH
jgi:cobalt-zinc-cadmium efflux system outer membrane protein